MGMGRKIAACRFLPSPLLVSQPCLMYRHWTRRQDPMFLQWSLVLLLLGGEEKHKGMHKPKTFARAPASYSCSAVRRENMGHVRNVKDQSIRQL